jgi:hypothetical protein
MNYLGRRRLYGQEGIMIINNKNYLNEEKLELNVKTNLLSN